ncbi:type III-A CRISPR-associated RAMP protein Csm4 [Desulfolucanica intricata]|uniref:type III-A CRISPR-associated RAMP protein Csm4 n=1 Tax=Desulfolucanica intricata TaxID=1285191 RepID=UPI000830BBAB|nr:type III-A CRISPR-associated RAMP protein Csm4 [Desulfolucanica intricata]
MSLWLVKLKFKSPLHLGKSGIGMEAVESFARSDTLFSGLCYAWANVYGKDAATELLESFTAGKPPFRISSAFPFKDKTYFLPRPLSPANLPGDEKSGYSFTKEFNRLPLVSLEVFKQWVHGEAIDIKLIPEMKEKLTAAALYQRVPRVQLDRVTCASGLFHAGLTVFNEDAGLYCLIAIEKNEIRKKLEGIFNWLGESGLGGMRSLGYGRFEPEWVRPGNEWTELWNSKHSKGAWCLLSLVHPTVQERKNSLDSAFFEIVTRDGWAASPFTIKQVRRKSCKMFAEGSVLPYLPTGSMADVTPSGWENDLHALYRYGCALAVPVEVNN